MSNFNDLKYGIKYRVYKLSSSQFILFPISLVEVSDFDGGYMIGKKKYSSVKNKDDLKKRYVIDSVFSMEDLNKMYGFNTSKKIESIINHQYTVCKAFYNEYSQRFFYIDSSASNNVIEKFEIDFDMIRQINNNNITYLCDKDNPFIMVNEENINELLNCKDSNELRNLLEKYKESIIELNNSIKRPGFTTVQTIDGKIGTIKIFKSVEKLKEQNNDGNSLASLNANQYFLNSDNEISYDGLRKAIKEKVFGHDKEIDTFAQKIYMNYTALETEGTESILLVGPTGTGKTETINAACSYLDIPSVIANASNIVPEGIVGESMEDILLSLYSKADRNLSKAKRGLIFLDEFDKLNDSDLNIKTIIKNILLTFNDGATFSIGREHQNIVFNTAMINKIYAGVFSKITDNNKRAGFVRNISSSETVIAESEVRKKIVEKQYLTLEELSRISTVLTYSELDRETKKHILLESKLSELSKKRSRYKRQFGIDIEVDEGFVDALLDSISNSETGMRSVNNVVKRVINEAEKSILENENKGYKKLVLTKDTVDCINKFDLF